MKCPFCAFDNIEGADVCENCFLDLTSIPSATQAKSFFGHELLDQPISKLDVRETPILLESDSILKAVKKMNDYKSGCVLISNDKGDLSGILTERDILFRMSDKVEDLAKIKCSQMMTYHVETLSEKDNIKIALNQMSVQRFRHIPILRKGKKPGIISSRDMVQFLAKELDETKYLHMANSAITRLKKLQAAQKSKKSSVKKKKTASSPAKKKVATKKATSKKSTKSNPKKKPAAAKKPAKKKSPTKKPTKKLPSKRKKTASSKKR